MDTGCQQSVVLEDVCRSAGYNMAGPRRVIEMLNGESTSCYGETTVAMVIGQTDMKIRCLVASELVCKAGMIIGVDVIRQLGGVMVNSNLDVRFGDQLCVASAAAKTRDVLEIHDKDFTATFNGSKWTMEWKWENGEPELTNQCAGYRIPSECREVFDDELSQWIRDGWLVEYDPARHGTHEGIIPLLAVKQPNKERKVRPVMDFRELNCYVKSHPGLDSAVCQDKLRNWRMRSDRASILDLRKAYLQIHVSQRLQRFQVVRHRGKVYVMTRMGFGLNIGPKVMTKIISTVLSLNDDIAKGTDHYIDDIWVDESRVTVEKVRRHLANYGLTTKEPVPLRGARVLGLGVDAARDGVLKWKRDGDLPSLGDSVTKRSLFSAFGKLTGHYPVAGWLRTACSYVKRLTNEVAWDAVVPQRPLELGEEIMKRVRENDPVRGRWGVYRDGRVQIWCDASNMAVGCCLTVNGEMVEDAAWMRKEDDCAHINVAELDAVVKGLTLVLRWGFVKTEIVTDSASVFHWVNSILEDTRRPKVSGLGEMIIKRRLGIISQLFEEYGMDVTIRLVPSAENLADALTRVPRNWLKKVCVGATKSNDDVFEQVRNIHNLHHLGVNRTLFVARKSIAETVSRDIVERVIHECNSCRSIDPSPVRWERGQLSVPHVWQCLALDITYVNKKPYLSMVDCGPSRFAIWRNVRNESTDQVIYHLKQVFLERGAPSEILTDNGTCFTSREMRQFLKSWRVDHIFSCAYRHSGNAIAERNHRTIKRMVARSGGSVERMVYWYNNTPNSDDVVPADEVFRYQSVLPSSLTRGTAGERDRGKLSNPYKVGDEVFVRPPNARCTTPWNRGIVTRIVAQMVVEVDGTNRHVSDVRRVVGQSCERTSVCVQPREIQLNAIPEEYPQPGDGECSEDAEVDDSGGSRHEDNSENSEGRPSRDRAPPKWLANFYVD